MAGVSTGTATGIDCHSIFIETTCDVDTVTHGVKVKGCNCHVTPDLIT